MCAAEGNNVKFPRKLEPSANFAAIKNAYTLECTNRAQALVFEIAFSIHQNQYLIAYMYKKIN